VIIIPRNVALYVRPSKAAFRKLSAGAADGNIYHGL
jgi:hypothetical protein